nr:hypothetical protein [Streptomyces hygroscopicus]
MSKYLRVLPRHSNHDVAVLAEQAAHDARVVVVVDRQTFALLWLAADGAPVTCRID